ncbi:hypothetical protein V8G54_009222 [Vigna mungo]|uniref:C6H2-type domain-containing protein n=1 Tax=Vigna mungo TaxID=3915 RepID=A0AAQ3NVQ2_VIGMU
MAGLSFCYDQMGLSWFQLKPLLLLLATCNFYIFNFTVPKFVAFKCWCPKCMNLKLPRAGSAFCSQECFKSSWSSHKSVHLKAKLSSPDTQNSGSLSEGWLYCLKSGQAWTPKLPYFDWTGSLRPSPISNKRIVPDHIDKPDWADDGIPKVEPNSVLQYTVEVDNFKMHE